MGDNKSEPRQFAFNGFLKVAFRIARHLRRRPGSGPHPGVEVTRISPHSRLIQTFVEWEGGNAAGEAVDVAQESMTCSESRIRVRASLRCAFARRLQDIESDTGYDTRWRAPARALARLSQTTVYDTCRSTRPRLEGRRLPVAGSAGGAGGGAQARGRGVPNNGCSCPPWTTFGTSARRTGSRDRVRCGQPAKSLSCKTGSLVSIGLTTYSRSFCVNRPHPTRP